MKSVQVDASMMDQRQNFTIKAFIHLMKSDGAQTESALLLLEFSSTSSCTLQNYEECDDVGYMQLGWSKNVPSNFLFTSTST